jgi:hypothetical protein
MSARPRDYNRNKKVHYTPENRNPKGNMYESLKDKNTSYIGFHLSKAAGTKVFDIS